MTKENIKLEQLLCDGIETLGVEHNEHQVQQLLTYLDLLSKWNKTHNLTAITDPEEMLTLHLLDSISILSSIKGQTLLDVGSGAGLPGIVIAIFCPNIKVVSVDTRGKKIQFQTLAASTLGLDNFSPIKSRIETFEIEEKFCQIISRAFSSLDNFISWTQHLIKDEGEWLAMKGQIPDSELVELQQSHKMKPVKIDRIDLPNFSGARHLLTFKPLLPENL